VILLASLAVGVVAYLAAGLLTGYTPQVRGRVRTLGRAGTRGRAGFDRQVWLLQAGTELSVVQFLAGSVAAAVVTLVLVGVVTGDPIVAVVPAVAIGLLPRAFFGRRRARRLAELQQAWPDGLRHIVGGVESGMSLNQSIASLATSGPEPLRLAFERFAVNARMVGLPAALEIVKGQLANSTSDRVIEVLLLAHERGGRIVTEVLSDLAEATTKDLKTIEEIASDQLEPKINARAVFALPWLVLVLLTASAGPFRAFYRSAAGVAVIVAAAVMSAIGILIVERMSKDEPEERVFAGAGGAAAAASGGGGAGMSGPVVGASRLGGAGLGDASGSGHGGAGVLR
jgi:tight adherence protein B